MTSAQNLANMSQDYGVIPMSNRNLFIDGHFDQWSPGSANVTPTTLYNGPVMWLLNAGTGGAATIAAIDGRTNAGGLAFMDSPPLYYAQYTQTTVATSAPLILQRLENVATGAGKSLTFSIKAWCAAGTVPITSILLRQNFGSGSNSPSGQVLSDVPVNWALTTTPKRFSVRLDVPSIAGKTIGNQGGDSLVVGFALGFGNLFTVGFAEAQLEYSRPQSSGDLNGNGGEPTAFEYRGLQAEMARVSRYFQSMGGAAAQYGMGGVWNATTAYVMGQFPTMRAAPSIVLAALNQYWLSAASGNQNPSGFGASYITPNTFQQMVNGTGLVTGQACMLQSANSAASFLYLDARL